MHLLIAIYAPPLARMAVGDLTHEHLRDCYACKQAALANGGELDSRAVQQTCPAFFASLEMLMTKVDVDGGSDLA